MALDGTGITVEEGGDRLVGESGPKQGLDEMELGVFIQGLGREEVSAHDLIEPATLSFECCTTSAGSGHGLGSSQAKGDGGMDERRCLWRRPC